MIKRQAYKFEITPNGEQRRLIINFVGASRFVYNKALDYHNTQYKQDPNSKFSYNKLSALMSGWKKDVSTAWLKCCYAQVLQQSLKDLEQSFKRFFSKQNDYPTFKKRGIKSSFRYQQGVKLDQVNKRVYLPKIGWVRYRGHRDVVGAVKNITVSIKGGKYFVSILAAHEIERPLPKLGSMIGIDVGITRFATLSDGSFIEPLNIARKKQKTLTKYQRRLAKKVRFSKNWMKAKTKVQKVHTKIANSRNDYIHKITNTLSKNHAIICIEDLKILNMTKKATKGNKATKSGLNKSILDQGWGEFRRQLEYKLEWNGGQLITVNPRNTSRTCPCCGFISKDNRKTQSKFECLDCGYTNNADHVGAINILAAGRAVLACGEGLQLDPSLKQEPTKAS